MNSGRNALAIIGAEALVAAGYVQNWRIELLVEGFGEGFAEPFEAGVGEVFSKGITTMVRPASVLPSEVRSAAGASPRREAMGRQKSETRETKAKTAARFTTS